MPQETSLVLKWQNSRMTSHLIKARDYRSWQMVIRMLGVMQLLRGGEYI